MRMSNFSNQPKLVRLALACALALAGTVIASSSAKAQTVDVDFQGTLDPECTFGSPSGTGTLTFGGSPYTSFTSDTVNVDVTCNTTGSALSVDSTIVPGGSNPSSIATLTGTATVSGGGSTTNGGAPTALGLGTKAIGVTLAGDNGSTTITAGNYDFTVTLTATP